MSFSKTYVAADADFEEVPFHIPHILNWLQPCQPSFAPKAAGQVVRYYQEMTTVLIRYYDLRRISSLELFSQRLTQIWGTRIGLRWS